jgi:hypothetical protein
VSDGLSHPGALVGLVLLTVGFPGALAGAYVLSWAARRRLR